jgi:hypothetical protein
VTTYRNHLPQRISDYFKDNPDEELTYADVQTKFSARPRTVERAVQVLCEDGVLERVHVVRKKRSLLIKDAV